VTAPADVATTLGLVEFPAAVTSSHFLKLELMDGTGKAVSSNFYWLAQPGYPDILTDLNKLSPVKLDADAETSESNGTRVVKVKLHNPSSQVALMAHVQLRKGRTGERVLPVFYSDNYVSLVPGETREVTIEAEQTAMDGQDPLVVVDGWNVTVGHIAGKGVAVEPNVEAQPEHWPATGLPFETRNLR